MSRSIGVLALLGFTACSFDVGDEPTADVEVSWNLVKAGDIVGCDDVGVSAVQVDFRSRTGGHRFADWFDCAGGSGLAAQVPVDDYDVAAAALGGGGDVRDEIVGASLTVDDTLREIMPALEFSL